MGLWFPVHQGGQGARNSLPTHRLAFVCGPPDPAGSVTQGGSLLLSAEAVPGWSLSLRAVQPTHLVAREIVVLARGSELRLQCTFCATQRMG